MTSTPTSGASTPSAFDERPGEGEFAPFYAGYLAYVEGSASAMLRAQRGEMAALLASVPLEREGYRYAAGKWSVREVVAHLAEAERIFATRLLRIARADATPMPGFDENAYAEAAGAGAVPLARLAAWLDAERAATLALLDVLPDEAAPRVGTANGHAVSARALVHILAGHTAHHLAVLRDRYAL